VNLRLKPMVCTGTVSGANAIIALRRSKLSGRFVDFSTPTERLPRDFIS